MTQPSQWPEQDPTAVPPPPPAAPNPPPASDPSSAGNPPSDSPPTPPPGASAVPPADPTQPLYPGAQYGGHYGGQYGTPQPHTPYPPAAAGPPPSQPTNGMSIAALVVGIVGAIGVCCYGVGGYIGAVGAILGHVARRQIARTKEGGGPLALTGIIAGWIATGIAVIATIFWVWVFIVAANDPTFFET